MIPAEGTDGVDDLIDFLQRLAVHEPVEILEVGFDQRSLMNPTDISKEVYEISKDLFDDLWDGITPLRLLGIAMTNITREETVQFSLFQDEGRERARKIDRAKDALNAKFGAATIVRGSSIQSKIDVGKKYKAQIELQQEKEK